VSAPHRRACLIKPIVVRQPLDAPPFPDSPAMRLAYGTRARARLRRDARPGSSARPRTCALAMGRKILFSRAALFP
jgi:hypothetical protein